MNLDEISSVRSDMFSIHYIPLLTELEYSYFS
jgi:hypothetical protein